MSDRRRPARYSTDIVVIDLEATCEGRGLFRLDQSNIIEIGAVRLHGRTLESLDTFSELVRPRDWPITPFITEMTGITPESVASCDTFDRVISRFISWFGPRNKAMFAAYGVYYDMPLLRKECGLFDVNYRKNFVGGALDVRTVALLWLAENGITTSGITLDRVIDRMGLDLDLGYHRALDDARAGAAILQHFHNGAVDI